MSDTPKPAFNRAVVEVLKEAWLNGQIQFTRTNTYNSPDALHIAPLGEVFYLIDYRTDKEIVYEGAYKLSTRTETKLLTEEKLNTFLIHQLSKELE